MELNAHIPEGPLDTKWETHRLKLRLVNPANKRKYHVLVVGTGLAGASAASSLAELGYRVSVFFIHDSARRAHSIAAQGGINAAKNYSNDGDSVSRLFHDTIKGGDYRSREANVHRLAEVSNSIIDQCVAQGVPFAREYGGMLTNRSFGGAQVSRTFYARGQTGQQLLLGAYGALNRQIKAGKVQVYAQHEMMDLIVEDNVAKGIITRNTVTGEVAAHTGHAVILCTGGYGNVYYLSTNAMASNVTATYRCYKRGAGFANPCYTQIHPTCIPVSGQYQSKLTLMSESLRNDGRVWVPKEKGNLLAPSEIKEADRDYYLERRYPSFGNLVPRDVASRAAKQICDEGRGVGQTGLAVYLDFAHAIGRDGKDVIASKYGNLFEMYQKITDKDPYQTPMEIYPAAHYTMGGLWVDYNLMSTIGGLFVLGEANCSDHGANRLGASALMQGLADGYFIIPITLGGYLSQIDPSLRLNESLIRATTQSVSDRLQRLINLNGTTPVDDFHRQLGTLIWDACGMSRSKEGLQKALQILPTLKEKFWQQAVVPGDLTHLNQPLERAGRIIDFIEFAPLMCQDALKRNESCGGHFREEYQTPDNEALRNDKDFSYVAVWEYAGENTPPKEHHETLQFEVAQPSHRSYK